jgi:Ala-tRNA(Pro) deacylase
MTIAATQQRYLVKRNAHYDLMLHRHSGSSHETAEAAHVPVSRIAKAVVVKDASGYALVVIPASSMLRLSHLRRDLDRDFQLVSEAELGRLFADCEPGAVPPLGPAYGIETLLDEALTCLSDVYFEAGDHEQLVHLSGDEFLSLLGGARRGYYSRESLGI